MARAHQLVSTPSASSSARRALPLMSPPTLESSRTGGSLGPRSREAATWLGARLRLRLRLRVRIGVRVRVRVSRRLESKQVRVRG